MLGGSLYQRDEVASVVCSPTAYVNAGYYLSPNAVHEVALDPFAVICLPPVLFVEPPNKATGGKARGIHGEIRFDGLEG